VTPTSIRIDAILPTYNRADRLHDALQAHAGMDIPQHVQYRLIVVDNNSTDTTPAVVEAFRERALIDCDYVFEPRQGLSHARNAGLGRVNADIVAFIDDDCYPATDWLSIMAGCMTGEAEAGLLGGSAFLFDQDDLPITIMTDPQPARLSPQTLFSGIAGLNFCFPARLLDAIGNFDTCLGAGSMTKSAEDIDFFYRTMLAGQTVDYLPELKVYHHHGRKRPDDKQRLLDGYLLGRGAFYAKYLARLDGTIVRAAYWECRSLLVDGIARGNMSSLRYLGLLAKGALAYPACRIRQRLGR
jgi:glycosyltransferase involved in cell wall biosynthesis